MIAARSFSLLVIGSIVGVCGPAKPSGAGSLQAMGEVRTGCTGRAAQSRLYPAPGVEAGEVDLDCDGTLDSVLVRRQGAGGLDEIELVFKSPVRTSLRFPIEGEGRFKIAGIADLNDDGVQDVLVAETDESITLVPHVVLVGRDSAVEARFDPRPDVATIMPYDRTNACTLERAWPTLVRRGESRYVVSRFTSATRARAGRDCGEAQSHMWLYRDGRFQVTTLR